MPTTCWPPGSTPPRGLISSSISRRRRNSRLARSFSPGPESEGARDRGDDGCVRGRRGAHAIVTDCWVSMGDEDEFRRHNLLKPYQVNEALMGVADKDAVFMHCLPAHRGEEVTDEIMDGPRSVVFDEAENRLHAQKGILAWCMGVAGRMSGAALRRHATISSCRSRSSRWMCAAASCGSEQSIDTIISRHGYPDAVSRVLGEAAALTVLLGSSLKFQGRFQLQTKTDGPIEMIVVDFDAPDRLRATARFDQESLDAMLGARPEDRRSDRFRLSCHDHRSRNRAKPLPGRRGAARGRGSRKRRTNISGNPSRSRRGCGWRSPSNSRTAGTPIGPAA